MVVDAFAKTSIWKTNKENAIGPEKKNSRK
jgi:hypothetical protein